MFRTMATETTMSGFTDDWQGERTLAECNMYMLMTAAETCDVSFLVGPTEEIVRAHRYILISRSCVFYSMLCGQWSKEDAVKTPDVTQEFFTEFLTFLYTDDCSLTAENVTGLLYLSKKYAVHRLSTRCLSFLQTNLTPENACIVLEQAHFFDEDKLFKDALKIIHTNVEISLKTKGFNQLCHICLNKILMLNDLDLHIKPEEVFDRVLSWASSECSRQGKEDTPRNQRNVLGESVYLIGFTGFDAAGFVQKVVPSTILDESECLKIISNITCPDADVGLFRCVGIRYRPDIAILQTVDMYDKCIELSNVDTDLFKRKYVVDALNIKCDQETVLHSITLPPADAKYTVTIKQASNTLLTAEECTTTLTNAKIDLPSSVTMKPGLSYCVEVKHTHSEGHVMLMMVGVKDHVCIRNKNLNISRDVSGHEDMRGLIMKLTVS